MKKWKKIAMWLAFSLSLTATAIAGNPQRVGTAGAMQVLIPVGSAGISMGSAVSANITGIEALYWNPAGLAAGGGNTEALFSNMSYIADISVNNVSVSTKLGSLGKVAFSLKALNFGNILQTTTADPDGLSGTTFSPTYLVAGLSYARAMTDRIFIGITGKVISERIQGTSATGVAFDAGIQYVTPIGVRLGVVIKNLGTQMVYSGSELETFTAFPDKTPDSQTQPTTINAAAFDIPSSLELGVSYSRNFEAENAITLAGNFQVNNFGGDEYRAGLEYSFRKLLFVRGGYSLYDGNSEDYVFSGPTFGAGIQYSLGSVNFAADYAYRSARFFSGSQVFTVRLGF